MNLTSDEELRALCIEHAISLQSDMTSSEKIVIDSAEKFYQYIKKGYKYASSTDAVCVPDDVTVMVPPLITSFEQFYTQGGYTGAPDNEPLTLYDRMRDVIEAFDNKKVVMVSRSRQSGMSMLSNLRAIWMAERGHRVMLLSRSLEVAKHNAHSLAVKCAGRLSKTYSLKNTLLFPSGGSIECHSHQTIHNAHDRGHISNKPVDFVSVNDAAFSDEWFMAVTSIQPMLSSTATIFVESSHTANENVFGTIFDGKTDDDTFKLCIPWWDVPYLSKERMLKIKQSLGAEMFKSEWCCGLADGPRLD